MHGSGRSIYTIYYNTHTHTFVRFLSVCSLLFLFPGWHEKTDLSGGSSGAVVVVWYVLLTSKVVDRWMKRAEKWLNVSHLAS